MCFGEGPVTQLSRRTFLTTGVVAGIAAACTPSALSNSTQTATTPSNAGPGSTDVHFKWFGTNGWQIDFGNRTVLIDPWFGRFDSGFFRPGQFNPRTPLTTNQDILQQQVPKKADQILIGHGHWDHLADVPAIAKTTGAMVIGTETHRNILAAAGVPTGQLVIVKGGEYMQFDGYTIEVFPGLHSLGPTKQFSVPGHVFSVPQQAPTVVGDLPEGDSLIYQITIRDSFRIFLMSTANYIERWMSGLRPDVALVASIFSNQIHDFTKRLLGVLNNPRFILPTHWDNFEKPFSMPPQDLRDVFGEPGNLDSWVKEVQKLAPKSQVKVLKFFESFAP